MRQWAAIIHLDIPDDWTERDIYLEVRRAMERMPDDTVADIEVTEDEGVAR